MNELRKALEKIALENFQGNVPDDTLIKACDAYKIKSDFLDDLDYHVKVTKSLYDNINGIPQNEEICKAIIPGQTKVVNGVTYIYTATPNAKTAYDWRILKFHTNKVMPEYEMNPSAHKAQHQVNELFPKDLSKLKVLKRVGGSTGAQLVEDAKGNQYIMKKGSNTNNEHVKSEYYATQLYGIAGLKVPDMELYDDNGEAVLLSKFIPGVHAPSGTKDIELMSKGFAVDCLLANWDVYQNDNCLIDASGNVYRVDNGGSLDFRAQGSKKSSSQWSGKVGEWDSFIKYNPSLASFLDEDEKIRQVEELEKRKNDILGYAELISKDLKDKLELRIKDLVDKKNVLLARQQRKNRPIPPRTILPDAEMYKTFTEDELNDILANTPGSSYSHKVRGGGSHGRPLMEAICAARGFDGSPLVVKDADYWNNVSKDHSLQMFRGIYASNKDEADLYADEFKFGKAYYGGVNLALYGAGIYFHRNDYVKNDQHTKADYQSSYAYGNARGYAGRNGAIIEACLDKNAKIIEYKDAVAEIKKLANTTSKAYKTQKDKVDALEKELMQKEDDYKNITETTTNQVKTSMHWSDNGLKLLEDLNNINWGKVTASGDPDYMKFEEYMKTYVEPIITDNGGTIKEKEPGSGVYVIKLPNSKESYMVTKFQYENNAIKRKNQFAVPYSYPVKLFQDYVNRAHYGVINKAIRKELDNMGDKVTDMKKDIGDLRDTLTKENAQLQILKMSGGSVGDPEKDFNSCIYVSQERDGNTEAVGIWAAANGYDAIFKPNGNGGENGFFVVLNRTKIIVNM